MPHITIEMYKGRDEQTKREIAERTASYMCEQMGMKTGSVSVSIKEIDKDDWKEKVYDRVIADEDTYVFPGYKM